MSNRRNRPRKPLPPDLATSPDASNADLLRLREDLQQRLKKARQDAQAYGYDSDVATAAQLSVELHALDIRLARFDLAANLKRNEVGPTPERIAKGGVVHAAGHLIIEPGEPNTPRQTVRGYRVQDPLDRYHASEHIDLVQYRAGNELRTDFLVSRSTPGITARYAEALDPGADSAIDLVNMAHSETHAALAAVGPVLSPCLVHVICMGQTASSWMERQGVTGKRAKTEGMTQLRLGLNALAIHYRMMTAPSPQEVLKAMTSGEPIAAETPADATSCR